MTKNRPGIINRMANLSPPRFPRWLWILLPLLAALLLNLSPGAVEKTQAWQQFGRAKREHNLIEQAKALEIAARWAAEDPQLLNRAAEIYLDAGLARDAIRIWEPLYAQEHISAQTAYRLGLAYQAVGEDTAALKAWRAAAGEPDSTGAMALTVVGELRKQKDWPGAEEFLKIWVRQHPAGPDVQFELAKLVSLNDLAQARVLLQDAVLNDSAYAVRAAPLQKAIREALAAEDAAQAGLLLGRGLAQVEDWELAVVVFERATAQDPNYAEGWALLGEALQQAGEDGSAEIFKALTLNPHSPLIQVITGFYYRRAGDPEKALPYIEEAVRREPAEITWKIELGLAYAESGDLVRGLAMLRSTTQTAPQDVRTWKNLAWFCSNYEVELRETGLPAAREAVALDEKDSGSLDLMGVILYQLGDAVSAERFLQQAIQMDPASSPAFLHLGQLYWTTERPDAAKAALEQAVRLSKKDGQIHVIADRLLKRYFGEK